MENNNSISSSSENKPQITSSEGKQATTSGVQTQVKQAQEEALENLRAVIGGVNNQLEKEGYNISHDEAYAEDSNGPLLAYISQSIRSNIDIGMWYKYEKKEKKEYEQARKRKAPPFRPQQTVTAAALADYGSEYRFIIGVNFHDRYDQRAEFVRDKVPTQIAGIKVVTVLDSVYDGRPEPSWWEKNENATESVTGKLQDIKDKMNPSNIKYKEDVERKKYAWLPKEGKNVEPLPEETTLQSWHAEQKVLCFLKEDNRNARRSVSAIGIAHLRGPCTTDTAGKGSQDCKAYLERKLAKAQKGPPDHGNGAVVPYWYNKKLGQYGQDERCSLEHLEKNGVNIVLPKANIVLPPTLKRKTPSQNLHQDFKRGPWRPGSPEPEE